MKIFQLRPDLKVIYESNRYQRERSTLMAVEFFIEFSAGLQRELLQPHTN